MGDDDKGDRPNAPPTSRLGRLARLTALAPRALPMASEAVKKALGGKRTEAEEREAQEKLAENAKKTAEAMLKTLGEMKGLPLKLGQMASYIDGLAPPGYEDKFQETLKKLQAKAPPLSAEAARKVVIEDLGAPPEEIFAEWEAEPFAAASVGQVHRATTQGGDRVAVKVQYPGIDKAIENDLKSISLLETMIAPVGRKYQTKETLEEIKAVFLGELDYRGEAETQDLFRRVHADYPDIVVPRVHHALTTKRVLTSELIVGESYAAFCERASAEERNAASETIWRFMFKPLLVHGLLYADPHPGNYRFLGGGRVAFLDYGCRKLLPPELVYGIKRYVTAAMDERWEDFHRACIEVLGYDPDDAETYELYIEYTKLLLEPLVKDQVHKSTKEGARETIAFLVRGTKTIMSKRKAEGEITAFANLPKPPKAPPDFTFVNRLQWGLASVMGGMGGEANYHRMSEGWVRGPVLPLP